MLKLTLQVLFCLTVSLRFAALFGHLSQAWRAERRSPRGLAAEFRRELRRRGLLVAPPLSRGD